MICVRISLLTGSALYLRMLLRAIIFSTTLFVSVCAGWLHDVARKRPSPAIRMLIALILKLFWCNSPNIRILTEFPHYLSDNQCKRSDFKGLPLLLPFSLFPSFSLPLSLFLPPFPDRQAVFCPKLCLSFPFSCPQTSFWGPTGAESAKTLPVGRRFLTTATLFVVEMGYLCGIIIGIWQTHII